ncbi:MAG: D-alanine-D-alanine ligase [Campylobacterota bacterium]|nr:D-alanine-D-alanine ligase [Campylobacterota bacterium]
MSKKFGIIFGGESFEHEISVVSAITLKKVLSSFELEFVFLSSNREFFLIDSKDMKSNFFSSGGYKKSKKLTVEKNGFFQSGLLGKKKVEVDCFINLIHGADGEDGKIASLMEFYDIDFIGPRIEASVLSFNKLFTKFYAKEIGVKTLDYQHIKSRDGLKLKFDYPVIVKPLRLGSSIGVGVVKDKDELEYALDVAFEFDNEVLIEPFIKNVHEYNLAGCKTKKMNLSIIEKPQKDEFLDFDKKYLDFSRSSKPTAAPVSPKIKNEIESSFEKLYANLFDGSLIRCDFFVIDDEVYLNEINPIPGSMANYLFEDFGSIILELSNNLPKRKKITIDYLYINKIQSSKGKV